MVVVPKQDIFVQEQEAVKQSVPDSSKAVANSVSGFINSAMNVASEYTKKAEAFETENKKNDWQREYTAITKQYQLDYSKNPQNKQLTKNYESSVKNLNSKYLKEIPEYYKNSFNNITNDAVKTNDLTLNFWRKETDLKFQSNKFIDSINYDIKSITDSANTDKPIEESLLELEKKLKQAKYLYGNYEGNKIIKETKEKALKGYITNLIDINPVKAIDFLKNEEINKDLKLNKTEKTEFLKQANKHKIEIEQWNKKKEVATAIANQYDIFKRIEVGEASYLEIMDFVNNPENKVSERDKIAMLHIAGYGSYEQEILSDRNELNDLDKSNTESSGGGSSSTDKLTDTEKEIYRAKLFAKSNLYSVGQNLDLDGMKETISDIKWAIANKVVSQSDGDMLLELIQPRVNKILTEQTNEGFGRKYLIFNDYTFENKELNNLIKSIGGLYDEKKPHQNNQNFTASNNLNFLYMSNLNEVAREFSSGKKIKDISLQGHADFYNLQDFFLKTKNENRNILKQEAYERTLKQYAEGKGINIKDKTVEQVRNEIYGVQIEQKQNEVLKIVNSVGL